MGAGQQAGQSHGGALNESHYSRHWIMRELDNSLTRLSTDSLDILYLHRDFPDDNLEEGVRVLGDVIPAGKFGPLACPILGAGASPKLFACANEQMYRPR